MTCWNQKQVWKCEKQVLFLSTVSSLSSRRTSHETRLKQKLSQLVSTFNNKKRKNWEEAETNGHWHSRRCFSAFWNRNKKIAVLSIASNFYFASNIFVLLLRNSFVQRRQCVTKNCLFAKKVYFYFLTQKSWKTKLIFNVSSNVT